MSLFDELKINYTEEINNNIFMLNNFAVSNKDNAELKLFKDKIPSSFKLILLIFIVFCITFIAYNYHSFLLKYY